jgi:hypothetical protein
MKWLPITPEFHTGKLYAVRSGDRVYGAKYIGMNWIDTVGQVRTPDLIACEIPDIVQEDLLV